MIFNCILCLFIICFYLITHIDSKNKETKDKLFLIITFFVLFILVGTRAMNVGNDTLSYLDLFKKSSIFKMSILDSNTYYEKGYLIFNVLLSYISSSSRFFMFAMSLIFNYAVFKFIKDNSKNYLLSVLMYINLLFFYQSMTMMRQFLALSIVLLFSFKYVKEKNLVKFLISIIVASLFHSTALIAVFIYPIYYLNYNRKRVLIIIIASIFALLSLNQIYPLIASILNKETYYITMVGETKLANIISTLIYSIMYIFSLCIVKQDKRQKYGFYLYSLLFASTICFVSINMAVLSRVSQYYAILSIIALPNLINLNLKNNKTIINMVIVLFMMLYSSIVMIYRPEWNSAFNYKSCIISQNEYYCKISN